MKKDDGNQIVAKPFFNQQDKNQDGNICKVSARRRHHLFLSTGREFIETRSVFVLTFHSVFQEEIKAWLSSLNSATKARKEAENLIRDCDDNKVRSSKRIHSSLPDLFSKISYYDLKQEQAASERCKFVLVSLLIVDTRRVETTIARTQNMQICPELTQM